MNNRKWGSVALLLGLLSLGAWAGRPGVATSEVRGQIADKSVGSARLGTEAAKAEEKAIRAAAETFSELFNKGDVENLLTLWTTEGEYVSETGKVYQGKAQLRAILKKAVAATRGQKHTIKIDKIRFLKSDVAQEEGTVILTNSDGETDRGSYVALWLKIDGKWLLGSVRDVPEAQEEGKASAYVHLRPLSWLIGDWREKNGEATLSVRWSPGYSFLLMDWHVQRGEELLHVHQRLGWDAVNQRIRAWVFDSSGGYGDAVWQREGNTWTVLNQGYHADGKPARSINVWKYLTKDSFRWNALDREVDGLPMPDVEAVYVRKEKPENR